MRDLSAGTTILAAEWPGAMLITIGGWSPVLIAGIEVARPAAVTGVSAERVSTKKGAASFANLMEYVMEIAAGAPAPLAATLLPHKNQSLKFTYSRS